MKIKDIELDKIDDSVILNCRRTINVDDLKQSIKATGLQMPIGVKQISDDRFGLIYGFRRFTAIKELGYGSIACRLLEVEDTADLLILNLQENVTRKNLTAIEEAQSLQRIIEAGKSLDEFRETLGWSKTKITQRLSLLEMSSLVQESLQNDSITVNQARALDEAPGHIQEQLIDDAEKGMPARQIREQVDLLLNIVEDTSDQVVEVEDDDFADIDDTLNADVGVDELDPAIYSNIIKGFLLDLGAKHLVEEKASWSYEIAIRSLDFTKMPVAQLSNFVNAVGTLETELKTFGSHEARRNGLK